MTERDPLLHEVATALRDLHVTIVMSGFPVIPAPLDRAMDHADDVLDKVVDREGDIFPTNSVLSHPEAD